MSNRGPWSSAGTEMAEIGTYALLQAYAGPDTAFYVRGVTSILDGGAGVFRVDSADTTSADNGGTILVDASGRRWKREYSGPIHAVWFGVDVSGATASTTAMSNAIAAAPDGSTVSLPPGTILLDASLTIAKRLNIIGVGWNSVLQLSAAAGATVDVFLLKPANASDLQGMRFQDFYVKPVSGTPGRHAFNIDGTNASIAYVVFDHVRVDALGSYAVAVTNASGLANGTPYLASFKNCIFQGGMDLTNAGDNVNITGCTITGARDLKVALIGAATSDGGAHGLTLLNNNITCAGGVVVTNAWQGVIAYNNIEQTVASTNANNALIDIQGNASANVENLKIFGNYVGANSLYVADSIRVDRATAAEIRDNYVVRGSGVAYRVTANSIRTHIADNRQAPTGEAISTWLADLGTDTKIEYINPSTGVRTITPAVGFSTAGGSTGVYLTSSQIKAASSNGLIGFASGDPSTTGLDTAFSRTGANEISVGNGAHSDNTGHIVQTGGIDLGTSQHKRIKANRGTALVSGDFALSAGWGSTAAVSAVIGTDQGWKITVTAGGAGIGANPTITATFKDGTWTNSPISITKMTGGTGVQTHLTESQTDLQNVITFNGTPVSTDTYIVSSIVMGR